MSSYNWDIFQEKNWANADPIDRLDALRDFEKYNAEQQGREARPIVWGSFENDNIVGGYSDAKDTIYINPNAIDRPMPELLHTVAHEGLHALQADIKSGKGDMLDPDGPGKYITENIGPEFADVDLMSAEFDMSSTYKDHYEYMATERSADYGAVGVTYDFLDGEVYAGAQGEERDTRMQELFTYATSKIN